HDDFFDLFEGSGINEDAPGDDGFATKRAVFVEFDAVAVFEQKDFAGDNAELVSKRSMAEKMAVFAVDRDEVFGLHELKEEFLFFLARVPGNVNHSTGIVIVDERAAAKHVVQHSEDGFFVSRDDARRKDDRVIFFYGNKAVVVDSNPRKRRHRLSLR